MNEEITNKSVTNITDKNKTKKESIIESLASATTITSACEKAGINRETFYAWLVKDKKFAENIQKAKDSRIQIVEDSLYNQAVKGNVTALIFFLCNRAGLRWHNVNKIEHNIGKEFDQAIEKIGRLLK